MRYWPVFFLIAMLAMSAESADKGRRVIVKAVVGKAEAISPDSSIVKQCRVGMRVFYGWNIRTAKEASVDVAFESGVILTIGEDSFISLSENLEKTNVPIDTKVKRKDTL